MLFFLHYYESPSVSAPKEAWEVFSEASPESMICLRDVTKKEVEESIKPSSKITNVCVLWIEKKAGLCRLFPLSSFVPLEETRLPVEQKGQKTLFLEEMFGMRWSTLMRLFPSPSADFSLATPYNVDTVWFSAWKWYTVSFRDSGSLVGGGFLLSRSEVEDRWRGSQGSYTPSLYFPLFGKWEEGQGEVEPMDYQNGSQTFFCDLAVLRFGKAATAAAWRFVNQGVPPFLCGVEGWEKDVIQAWQLRRVFDRSNGCFFLPKYRKLPDALRGQVGEHCGCVLVHPTSGNVPFDIQLALEYFFFRRDSGWIRHLFAEKTKGRQPFSFEEGGRLTWPPS